MDTKSTSKEKTYWTKNKHSSSMGKLVKFNRRERKCLFKEQLKYKNDNIAHEEAYDSWCEIIYSKKETTQNEFKNLKPEVVHCVKFITNLDVVDLGKTFELNRKDHPKRYFARMKLQWDTNFMITKLKKKCTDSVDPIGFMCAPNFNRSEKRWLNKNLPKFNEWQNITSQ
jgi:hypothetical protein